METALLQLIKVITALYFNSLSTEKNVHVVDEMRLILNSIKFDTKNILELPGGETNIIDSLRHTAEWMICTDGIKFSRDNVIQRLKINLNSHNDYIKIAEDSLDLAVDEETAKTRLNELMAELRFEKKRNEIKRIVSKAHMDLNFNSSSHINIGEYVLGLRNDLEKLHVTGNEAIVGKTGSIDFRDVNQIKEALTKGRESLSTVGLIRTGLQGMDRAFGGGIPRGYLLNVGGITFNYKTGMLKDIPLHMPMYNTPWMWDTTKKPLISRISFETTVTQDVLSLASRLYEIQTKQECDAANLDLDIASKMLYEHFSSNGYHFILECFDPIHFSIYDLFKLYDGYIASGYEIHLASIDYLVLIAHNTIGERPEAKIQRTFEMARNYFYPKGITCVTGAQLNSEAKTIAQDKNPRVVERFADGPFSTDCKSLRDKFDLEIMVHIFKHPGDGKSYLCFCKGKHRGNEILKIPNSYNYWVYPFERVGGILYDGHDEPRFLTQVPSLIQLSDEDW